MSSVNGNRPTVSELLARFREEVRAEPFLTREEIAAEVGIPLRSLYEYVNENTTPRPGARKKIHAWLEQRQTTA